MPITGRSDILKMFKNLNVNADNVEVIHKFGRIAASSTAFQPISLGGIYRTPQVAGATKLRVKAGGNAADTAAGAGAREITLSGIDETGARVSEAVVTAGASASANTVTDFIRLDRFWVSSSGAYATAAAGSHVGDIVIENSAGSEDWGTIDATDFARSQSEIGATTIPLNRQGFLVDFSAFESTNKIVDSVFFWRTNILETAAPYTPMRMLFGLSSETGYTNQEFEPFQGPFPELTDLVVMAKVNSGTPEIYCEFTLVLFDA